MTSVTWDRLTRVWMQLRSESDYKTETCEFNKENLKKKTQFFGRKKKVKTIKHVQKAHKEA